MSDILNELQLVKKASQEQTAASQEIATHHLASIEKVETASIQAIARVESEFNQSVGELTEYAIAAHKKAIEDASGGKNTIIIDEQGNPNVMVCIPRYNLEDANNAILSKFGVDLKLGTGIPSAFKTNGVPRSCFYCAKYLASPNPKGSAVVGGAQPYVSVSYDMAKTLCNKKGNSWHLMSIHEWAAIAIYSLAFDTVPRGNTNYGQSHENKLEVARRFDNAAPGDTFGTARTYTGNGPLTWSHDHTEWGVQDLVGNVLEWLDQMKLDNGQIITTLDNNPHISEANWHKHGSFFDSPNSNMDGNGNAGSPVLSHSIINRNGPFDDNSHDYPHLSNNHFAAIQKSDSYSSSELLRQLLIESESSKTVAGAIVVRNYGNRYPHRGGDWFYGAKAGLGALNVAYSSSVANINVGYRPCFSE